MLIKEESLRHWIDNFYGYGSWDAKTWFIGYEEGGGDLPEEVAEKFNYFSSVYPAANTATLCDIRELYKNVTVELEGTKSGVFKNLHEYRFGQKAMPHGAWKNLIAFVHGFRGQKLPDVLEYQKKKFATGNESVIQFYPLPSPHNHAWYYSWLDMPQFPFLKSRSLYEEHLYPLRITGILNKIRDHRPELVLMYSMSNINVMKNSVQEFFHDAKFKMVKGAKLETPQHHRADFNGTTLLITTQQPTLRHNRIETGFDWYEFGKKVKSGQL